MAFISPKFPIFGALRGIAPKGELGTYNTIMQNFTTTDCTAGVISVPGYKNNTAVIYILYDTTYGG